MSYYPFRDQYGYLWESYAVNDGKWLLSRGSRDIDGMQRWVTLPTLEVDELLIDKAVTNMIMIQHPPTGRFPQEEIRGH